MPMTRDVLEARLCEVHEAQARGRVTRDDLQKALAGHVAQMHTLAGREAELSELLALMDDATKAVG